MSQNNKNGFTLVEILVIAPIVILVIGAFVTTIVSLTGQVLSSRESNNLTYNIQDALNRIEQDIKISNKFLAINNLDLGVLTPPQGYDNNILNFNNVSTTLPNALILEEYAITSNPASSTRNLVYLNTPNLCNSLLLTQNQPMKINIVYFVKDNILWRRTIMPSNYKTAGCDAKTPTISPIIPWQQPSCEPSRSTAICESKDIKLADGIMSTNDFNIHYFSSPDSSSEISDAIDSSKSSSERDTLLQSASTAQINITSNKNIVGRDISQTGTVRASNSSNN